MLLQAHSGWIVL